MTKYHNIPTAIDGIRFDSRKEANRFYQLRLMERAGEISNLRRQVEYELIPAQKTPAGRAVRPVKYVADFVYDDHGKTVVEDVKGVKTREFQLKSKLMLWRYGIVVEIA